MMTPGSSQLLRVWRRPGGAAFVALATDPLHWAYAALAVCTAFDGATTHLPAWVLRAGVMLLAALAWPAPNATLCMPAIRVATSLGLAYGYGLWQSDAVGLAVQPIATLVCAVMAYVALAHATAARRQGACQALLATGVVHALWAVGQRTPLWPQPGRRAAAGFFSPIDLAAFLAPLALWAGCRMFETASRRMRWVYLAQATLLAAGLLATNSRGGILAFVFGLGLMACASPARPVWRALALAPQGRRVIALLLVLGASICGLSGYALRYRFNTAYDADAFSRIEIWRACLALLRQQPFGLGTGNLEDAMRQLGVPTQGAVRYLHVANNAHNTFLQTAVESGVVGIVAWLVVLATAQTSLGKRLPGPRRCHRGVAVALLFPALTATTWQLTVMALMIAVWSAELWPASDASAIGVDAAAGTQRRAELRKGYSFGSPHLWWAAALCTAVAIAPGALSSLCLLEARRRVEGGQTAAEVRVWTERATRFAPWSVNTALVAEHLRTLTPNPPSPLAQLGALAELAERYPKSPEPLRRAALQLQAMAQTPDQHTQVATLWQMAAARDPHNALFWLYAAQAAAQGHVPRDAPALYDRALQEEPLCAGAWLGRAEQAAARSAAAERDTALQHVIDSAQRAPSFAGFARSVLALDAQQQIRFNHLILLSKDSF